MTIDELLENMSSQDKNDLLKTILTRALDTDGELPDSDISFDDSLKEWIHCETLSSCWQAERVQEAVSKTILCNPCPEKMAKLIADALETKKAKVNEYVISDQLRFLVFEGGIRKSELPKKTHQEFEL